MPNSPLGGDEFLMLLDGDPDSASAALVARGASSTLRTMREATASPWTREAVGRATGQCLRGLPTYTGAIACLGVFLGPTCLVALTWGFAGAWLSGRLRSRFPLT